MGANICRSFFILCLFGEGSRFWIKLLVFAILIECNRGIKLAIYYCNLNSFQKHVFLHWNFSYSRLASSWRNNEKKVISYPWQTRKTVLCIHSIWADTEVGSYTTYQVRFLIAGSSSRQHRNQWFRGDFFFRLVIVTNPSVKKGRFLSDLKKNIYRYLVLCQAY